MLGFGSKSQKKAMFWDFVSQRDGTYITKKESDKPGKINVVFLPTGAHPSEKNYITILNVPATALLFFEATTAGQARKEWASGLYVLVEDESGYSRIREMIKLEESRIHKEYANLKKQLDIQIATAKLNDTARYKTEKQVIEEVNKKINASKKSNDDDE